MQAIRFHGVRDIRLDEIPTPEIDEDDVLIEVKASSLDGTDLEMLNGVHRLRAGTPLPVLGHEYAGVVVATGAAVDSFRVGDRVTGPWGINCGACPYCRQGQPNLCLNQLHFGMGADGPWAEYMRVPARMLVRLPDAISYEDGALLCCALPTAMRGLERGQVRLGDGVAVIGLGQMGLSAVLGARLKGASPIIGIDPVASRAELARRFGATSTIDPRRDDASSAVRALTGGLGVERCVLTASSVDRPEGAPTVADLAFGITRPGGQIISIGLPGRMEVDLNVIQGRELTIVGSKCLLGPDYLAKLLDFVAAGGVDLPTYRAMVTHTVRLSELCDALLGHALQGAIKIIIVPG